MTVLEARTHDVLTPQLLLEPLLLSESSSVNGLFRITQRTLYLKGPETLRDEHLEFLAFFEADSLHPLS